MAITKIPAAGFTGNNFRNIIINGSMDIAQRGTSTSSVSTTQYPSLDRFQMYTQTAGSAVFTVSQDADVPSGQGFAKSHKIDVTTALGTYGASNFTILRQRIEGQMLGYLKKGTLNAESLTLSFWVKSNKTGTYIAELYDNDNSRQISKSYTIDNASTWEKKTLTFAGDTSGSLTLDNSVAIDLDFYLSAGSNYTSGTLNTSWNSVTTANRAVGQVNLADNTANEWYITGVQLEAGQISSEFEFLPHDVNLQRCSRYCFSVPYAGGDTYHGIMQGFFPNTTLFIGDIPLPTRMRDSISLTTSGSFGLAGTTDYSASSFTLENASLENSHSVEFRCTTSGVTAGQAARFRNQNDASAKFILTSEL